MSETDSFLSGVPRLRDLYQHVIRRVSDRWEELCILLELDEDGAKLAAIRRDHILQGVEMCCLHAIQYWLKGQGAPSQKSVCWDTIITCLQDMGLQGIVRDIKQAFKGMVHV